MPGKVTDISAEKRKTVFCRKDTAQQCLRKRQTKVQKKEKDKSAEERDGRNGRKERRTQLEKIYWKKERIV